MFSLGKPEIVKLKSSVNLILISLRAFFSTRVEKLNVESRFSDSFWFFKANQILQKEHNPIYKAQEAKESFASPNHRFGMKTAVYFVSLHQ